MTMSFTPAQEAAIVTHDRNLIVVAGAGSGKTRVLVERYLALLEANRDWPLNALVAITFTKKAATEMRDRVRQTLEKRYNTAQGDAEAQHWSQLLSEIDSARIDTIHGLCASLLRANAAEIGVDPDFDVLDEVEAAILLQDVVDNVLAEAVADRAATVELLVEYGPGKVRAALADSALINTEMDNLPDDVAAQWDEWIREAIEQHIATFLREVDAIGTIFDPPDDSLGKQWAICIASLDRLQDGSSEDPIEDVRQISSVHMRARSWTVWQNEESFSEAKAALGTIRQLAKDVLKVVAIENPELERRAAELVPLWYDMVSQVRLRFAQAKSRRAALDFDDLERLTSQLLQNPHVVDRYRGREFRHLLVDEFQDTNASQWKIVKALAGLHQPGSMFVVGDQKQSIYAFRGADVSVFGDVRQEITDASNHDPIQMAKSFRTHHRLVNGFNAIFERLLTRDENSPVADFQVVLDEHMEAHRKPPPDPQTPSIEFMLIDKHLYDVDDDGHITQILDDNGEPKKLLSDERREWEATELAAKIKQMVADERLVHDRVDDEDISRPIDYGDIAILLQALSNVNILEDAFKQAGVPFVTVAGRGYYDRQEVWDLLNLLEALYNPDDNLALASALRSPLFSLSDDALFALRLPDEAGEQLRLWDAIDNPGEWVPDDEHANIEFARTCLLDLRSMAGRVTISELLHAALERTGYLAVLTSLPDGARRRGNVEKLLEIAQVSGHITLGSFTQYLRDLSVREVREGEAATDVSGAVQIMSVHASKGLEFSYVILADASWQGRKGSTDLLVFDSTYGLCCKVYDSEQDKPVDTLVYRQISALNDLREDAERLRLLYVAMTRAKDYVLVSGQATYDTAKDSWSINGWLGELLEVMDLTGLLANGMSNHVIPLDWGDVAITIPLNLPQTEAGENKEQAVDQWDNFPAIAEPQQPKRLEDLTIPRYRQVKHLAATQLAHLGRVDYAPDRELQMRYGEYFRRQVVQDAPTQIKQLPQGSQHVTARQIGDIVHEALQHWYLPNMMPTDKLMAILKSYAWRQGITSVVMAEKAVERAYRLLRSFVDSPVYEWVTSARQVYRELPFVYEHDSYIIHGVIDLLIQLPDERWVIVDYKTGMAPSDRVKMAAYARQYYLQVGMYAAAVEEQLGTTPETYVHFIQRAEYPVPISEAEWRDALSRKLSHRIRELLEDNPL